MGRIESSSSPSSPHEYHPVDRHRHNDTNDEQPIHAEVVSVASKVGQQQHTLMALDLAEQLTWTDTFYEHEPDIVAVFDIDPNVVTQYQRKNFLQLALCAVLWLLFASLYYIKSVGPTRTVVVFMFFCALFGVYFSLAIKAWVTLRAATNSIELAGIHLAISSVSVRYDQADPMVSTEKNRTFCCCGPETTLNLVQMKIAGTTKPKVYIGLKDPKNFARLVMMLKNENCRSNHQSGGRNNNNNNDNNMIV